MGFDIFILVFVLLLGVIGYRNGFVYTFVRMIGWLASVILAFIFCPKLSAFLKENTGFYDFIYSKVTEKMTETGITPDIWLHSFPSSITSLLREMSDSFTESLASSVTNIAFTVISFALIVVGIKLTAFVVTALFSKRKRSGLVGAVDGLMGLLSGLIIGIVMIFLLMLLAVPITTLTGNTFLLDCIESSVLAKEIFNEYILLRLLEIF